MKILLIIFCATLTAVAQLLLKIGASRATAGLDAKGIAFSAYDWKTLTTIFCEYANSQVIAGFFLYLGAAVLWIKVLSTVPLSYAAPFTGLAMIITFALSGIFLREHLPWMRIVGMAFTITGLCFVAGSY